jgi:hypothetical protein
VVRIAVFTHQEGTTFLVFAYSESGQILERISVLVPLEYGKHDFCLLVLLCDHALAVKLLSLLDPSGSGLFVLCGNFCPSF